MFGRLLSGYPCISSFHTSVCDVTNVCIHGRKTRTQGIREKAYIKLGEVDILPSPGNTTCKHWLFRKTCQVWPSLDSSHLLVRTVEGGQGQEKKVALTQTQTDKVRSQTGPHFASHASYKVQPFFQLRIVCHAECSSESLDSIHDIVARRYILLTWICINVGSIIVM